MLVGNQQDKGIRIGCASSNAGNPSSFKWWSCLISAMLMRQSMLIVVNGRCDGDNDDDYVAYHDNQIKTH